MAWTPEGSYAETCSCELMCPCNLSFDHGATYDVESRGDGSARQPPPRGRPAPASVGDPETRPVRGGADPNAPLERAAQHLGAGEARCARHRFERLRAVLEQDPRALDS